MSDVEQVEQDLLPAGVRAELESKHGLVVAIEIARKPFAFRGPTRPEAKRYRSMISRQGADQDAEQETLMTGCCIWPSGEELTKHLDKFPLAITSSNIAFQTAFGLDMSEVLKMVK